MSTLEYRVLLAVYTGPGYPEGAEAIGRRAGVERAWEVLQWLRLMRRYVVSVVEPRSGAVLWRCVPCALPPPPEEAS